MTGRIVRVFRERGFAFLKTDDDGSEVFAHCSNFVERDRFDLLTGRERVDFRVVPDRYREGKFGALDVVVLG
jgi:cold shock CspA family protein